VAPDFIFDFSEKDGGLAASRSGWSLWWMMMSAGSSVGPPGRTPCFEKSVAITAADSTN
jgi:hypothetical protein